MQDEATTYYYVPVYVSTEENFTWNY